MGSVPNAGRAFFPLDEELALLSGCLSPRLREQLGRLGAWIPFAPAAEILKAFTGVSVAEPTVRRRAEGAGAAYLAVQAAELERIETDLPEPPPGPEKLVLSVDGCMVRTVEEGWQEVKTLAIGQVEPPVQEKGEWVVHCRELSYFSRLATSEIFEREALTEIHRRGVERAKEVGAVVDGAIWCQGFLDLHCPDARRILDFPHAGGRIGDVAKVLFGEGTPEGQGWTGEQLHLLKSGGPEQVLDELRHRCALPRQLATTEQAEKLSEHLAYLEKREDQMQYPLYQQEGWPIGSGMVESANKLVVEARLKGAGMQWARRRVNAMLGLRNVVCSDRWDEAWPQIEAQLRQEVRKARSARREGRQEAAAQASVPEKERVERPGSRRSRPKMTRRRRKEALPQDPAGTPQAAERTASADGHPEPRSEKPHPWRRFNPDYLTHRRAEYAKL